MKANAAVKVASHYFGSFDAIAACADFSERYPDRFVLVTSQSQISYTVPENVILYLNGCNLSGNVIGAINADNGIYHNADGACIFGHSGSDAFLQTNNFLVIEQDAQGNIKLVSGSGNLVSNWTIEKGQTFTIGQEAFMTVQGKVLNIKGDVVVAPGAGRLSITDAGMVKLMDEAATLTSDEANLNITTSLEGKKVVYEDGKYQVANAIQINFVNIGAQMDAEVILDLKFRIPDAYLADIGAYATVTKNAKSGVITEMIKVEDLVKAGPDTSGRYVLSKGMASGEMMRDLTVKFYDSKGNLVEITDYSTGEVVTEINRSVADYARLALEKGNPGQKKLATALVTYGGYAQIFFGVDATNPAFNILEDFGIAVPSIDEITAETITQVDIKSDTDIGIHHTTTAAMLDSAISMVPHFVLSEGASIEDYTFTLTYQEGGQTKTKPLAVEYDAANNRYDVTIESIASGHLDYMYKVTVTKTATGETYELSTSVLAYARRVIEQSPNVKQCNMAKAMYLYNQAANEFFGK